MIDVTNLTYSYPPLLPDGERSIALADVSFHVGKGRCLAVTGANGCGKTTLCLAVAGLAPRLTRGRIQGQILVNGQDVQSQKPGTLADQIGLVMQDVAGQMFNHTVADEIAWGLENLGIAPATIDARIEQALAMVGLEHLPRDQSPQSLSGGEMKRLALASALALEPTVLILDEPSGGLSPLGRHEITDLLLNLRQTNGLTILLAESDSHLIATLADEMLVLDHGRIVAYGSPRDTYSTLDAATHPGISLPPALIFAHTLGVTDRAPLTVPEAAEIAAQYPPAPSVSVGAGLRPAQSSPNTGSTRDRSTDGAPSPAIELSQVHFAYAKDRPVLRGIDLTISQGEFVALTGENGAGKTTLARHLIGLARPTSGEVRIMGQPIAQRSIGQIAQQVGFAYQNPELQIFNPTVREEISFGPRNLKRDSATIRRAIDDALTQFGLTEIADLPPASLNFSTRRLIALASIAAMHTPIIVLDEPTVGLDAEGQRRIMDWLQSRHQSGAAILLITHDMELAARFTQRVIVMDAGRIVLDGPPRDVFQQVDQLATAGLVPPFAMRLAQHLHNPALAGDLTPEGAARTLTARQP